MNLKEKIAATVERIAPELIRLSHDVHDNPELGLEEFKACAWQVELLQKYGFTVETGCCANLPTSYRAVYKSTKPGPVIAFLAEYDALPTVGHGCGHNLFGATSCLAAASLKQVIDEVGGEIRVYGTPGEEGGENGSAKGSFVREGFFNDVDAALCVHPGDVCWDIGAGTGSLREPGFVRGSFQQKHCLCTYGYRVLG